MCQSRLQHRQAQVKTYPEDKMGEVLYRRSSWNWRKGSLEPDAHRLVVKRRETREVAHVWKYASMQVGQRSSQESSESGGRKGKRKRDDKEKGEKGKGKGKGGRSGSKMEDPTLRTARRIMGYGIIGADPSRWERLVWSEALLTN